MLGPLEFVTEVHGMYGPYYSTFCMADLTFVTNLRTYGPFGDYGHSPGGWNSFSVPVNKSKGTIVGFFVRAPHHVSELGVYVRPFWSCALTIYELTVFGTASACAHLSFRKFMSHINSGSQNIIVSLVSISVVLGSQAFRASTCCRLYVSRIPHADDKTGTMVSLCGCLHTI